MLQLIAFNLIAVIYYLGFDFLKSYNVLKKKNYVKNFI